MAGVEFITKEILREAGEKADAIVRDAEEKCLAIRKQAEDDGKAIEAKRSAEADRDAKAIASQTESGNLLRRRQRVLSVRQDIIGRTVRKAYDRLASLGSEEYFQMIGKLLRIYADPSDGEVLFGAKDLARLPEGFESVAEEAGKAAGGSLKISEIPADIENGFILRYGGIDENCSLKALFEDRGSELQDEVNRVLFG